VDVEVRPLRDEERAAAGGVAGRALATSPTSIWTWGEEPVGRMRQSLDIFVGFVQNQTAPIGALIGNHVVGVCGAAPPGECIRATSGEAGRAMPETIDEPGSPSRVQYVWAIYCTRDLDERHVHLGPVSVEPGLQGLGVGGLMMNAFVAQMDDDGEVAWLETDKPENVVFYRRHGFEEVEELSEHGLTSWWMRRDPR
jgi:ribosomal protein S18 acetylase RimI-like enzyme